MGGVYGTVKFVQYKIQDWISKEEAEYFNKLRKQQHYDKTQEHCPSIVQVVLSSLHEKVSKILDPSQITSAIKSESDAKRKLELWNDLKIAIFTKLATCIYISTLSAALLRVQLNHISAKVYSTKSTNSEIKSTNGDIQQWYLAQCHDFLADFSISHISKQFQSLAHALTESMPLQCKMGGLGLEALLKSFHNKINHHDLLKFTPKDSEDGCCVVDFFMPSQSNIDNNGKHSDARQVLIAEIWDVLDSNDFMAVANACTLSSFENFSRCIDAEIYAAKGYGPKAVDVIGGAEIIRSENDINSLPLAKLLPIINSKIELMTSKLFIESILSNDLLSKFCINVYDSFVSDPLLY